MPDYDHLLCLLIAKYAQQARLGSLQVWYHRTVVYKSVLMHLLLPAVGRVMTTQ